MLQRLNGNNVPEWDFQLRQFGIKQTNSAMKVGTDAIVLGSWVATLDLNPKRILDIGAGTGILSLMMAQAYPMADVSAIEIDQGAYLDASFNFGESPFSERLHLVYADALSLEYQDSYQLIISNPPYYTENTYAPNENRRRSRSDGRDDGLGLNTLFQLASRLLTDEGVLSFIAPHIRLEEIRRMATEQMFVIKHLCIIESTIGEPIRVMLALSRYRGEYTKSLISRLVLREQGSENYTDEYKNITSPFLY